MLKVNTDPNCPGADIRKGDSLHTWDTVHQDRGKHSMSSIPRDRWNEIFGPKEPEQMDIKAFARAWRKHAYR
jgi:hypothetical protein